MDHAARMQSAGLVLTRMVGQRIIIQTGGDEEIIIAVMDISGPRVRLGVRAPGTVTINREEVQIEKERHGRPEISGRGTAASDSGA